MYIEDIEHDVDDCIYNGEIRNHRIKISRCAGYLKIDIGFDPHIDTFIEMHEKRFVIPEIIHRAMLDYVGKDNQTYTWYHNRHKVHNGCEDELFWLSFVPGLILESEYPIIQSPDISMIREIHPDNDRESIMSTSINIINMLKRRMPSLPDKTMEIYTVDTCLDIASRIICRIESTNRIIHDRQKVKFLDNMYDYTHEHRHHRDKGKYYQGH